MQTVLLSKQLTKGINWRNKIKLSAYPKIRKLIYSAIRLLQIYLSWIKVELERLIMWILAEANQKYKIIIDDPVDI